MMVSAMGLELSMGSKRAKAMCAATRKTADGEGDADGGGDVLALEAQQPAAAGPDEQGDGGQSGGQAQRGKGRAGEVEEVGHGERVVAHGAMRQQGADVGNVGQIARVPKAPAERGG